VRRGGRRPQRFRVDVGGALNLVGTMLRYLSAAFLFPAAIAVGYGEPPWPFLVGAAAAFLFGLTLERLTPGSERVGAREGFLIVALAWFFGALFVAVPYVLAEPQLRNPLDAYFEAMSGLTTTGSSVLTDIPALDHSVAMWRQFSQWLGGMGIIVLALAILPRLRVGGRQLMEHEAPGPELAPLETSIRETARRLWLLYLGLTALMIAVLSVVAWTGADETMSTYEAVAHAFTTLPTGGFSTRARSIEEFGAVTQWVIAGFMILAGINFALLYRAVVRRDVRGPSRDQELRLYLALFLVASLVVLFDLLHNDLHSGEAAVRHAVFQVASMMTTTGYASVDYAALWTGLAALVLVALMFVGGSAGSTGGGIKPIRFLLGARVLKRELDQTVHPEAAVPIRFNGLVVSERTLRAIIAFILLYVGVFALGALVIAIDSGRANLEVGAFDAIAAAATSIGNVGPGFGFAGPMGSFDPFSPLSKTVMIVLMWMGRLELLPVVVLFTRSYWRG
jgi:trk system potassium uptake protein